MKTGLLPIDAIADKLELPQDLYEKRSPLSAKLSLNLLDDPRFDRNGKLILVTATTPTTSGEGKTVTSIGLVQGLERIGKRAILSSREPSLGPVFGMKGGAAGGGRSQVEPAEKINLHFHGDFHAITSAHNLLAALVDSHLFHGNALGIDPDAVTWPRTLDMNDRASAPHHRQRRRSRKATSRRQQSPYRISDHGCLRDHGDPGPRLRPRRICEPALPASSSGRTARGSQFEPPICRRPAR